MAKTKSDEEIQKEIMDEVEIIPRLKKMAGTPLNDKEKIQKAKEIIFNFRKRITMVRENSDRHSEYISDKEKALAGFLKKWKDEWALEESMQVPPYKELNEEYKRILGILYEIISYSENYFEVLFKVINEEMKKPEIKQTQKEKNESEEEIPDAGRNSDI